MALRLRRSSSRVGYLSQEPPPHSKPRWFPSDEVPPTRLSSPLEAAISSVSGSRFSAGVVTGESLHSDLSDSSFGIFMASRFAVLSILSPKALGLTASNSHLRMILCPVPREPPEPPIPPDPPPFSCLSILDSHMHYCTAFLANLGMSLPSSLKSFSSTSSVERPLSLHYASFQHCTLPSSLSSIRGVD
ncbi:unnamed protein product [Arabis nemorensis]|uniref:Uncharacterized protein n=1 Tax=Arabis nemorensis TaxID=586526 RepID=A0A565C8A0_9BRAS|nr:unnamed protein product [Arabis nemorensis]